MRVLFFEPVHTGHHFAYLGWMLPGFIDLPIEIGLATTPEAVESIEFEKSIAPFSDRLELVLTCKHRPGRNPIRNALGRLRDLRASIDRWRPEHVGVMYADGLWQLLALRVPPCRSRATRPVLEGWAFRGAFSYPESQALSARAKRRLWRKLLRSGPFSRLSLHDELLLDYSQRFATGAVRVELTADPVTLPEPISKRDARRAMGLPEEGQLIGCIGMADSRKGVDLAIEAAPLLPPAGEDRGPIRLLIAGPHSDAIRALLTQPGPKSLAEQERILSIDRFLDEREMAHCAASCDVVLAPYRGHSGRSSIVLWAAAAGRPVVGVAQGCVGHVVEREQLGRTFAPDDSRDLARSVAAMLQAPWPEADAERVRNYAQWHSIEHYQRMSAAFVRERLASRSD